MTMRNSYQKPSTAICRIQTEGHLMALSKHNSLGDGTQLSRENSFFDDDDDDDSQDSGCHTFSVWDE